MSKIDKKYWIDINDTFVMYGQNIVNLFHQCVTSVKLKKVVSTIKLRTLLSKI